MNWRLTKPYLMAITLLMLAIPYSKISVTASNQAPTGQSQSDTTAAYQVSLPMILTLDERPFLMALYNSTKGDDWDE